ncbi:MAG: FprA family A-type flavoprotein [Bacilli bacterium]|jgi:flavorubredoxin|nr:FprA family A-type flavoprotein [Bacilli bacterium]
MKAFKIKEGVYWVGAIDWNLREFHGYATEMGTTYNAYLIIDEKVTLIDNVKPGFAEEMLARVSSVIDPGKIEVIISNHGEPDHSGALKMISELAPKAKIYSSAPNGVKALLAMYGELPVVSVKTGDEISIGKRALRFTQAPMVHWPDNMVTYCPEDKILYSNDIFGQHYATSRFFDGENDLAVVLAEAKKYYANIVLPYSKQAKRAFEAVKDLDIEMIATSHGVIWKDHIKEIFALYDYLVNSRKRDKAVVVFDSMWGSTALMARTIAEAFRERGIDVRLYQLGETPDSEIITDIADAKYLAVGSPTFNNTILPKVAGFLNYMQGLAPVNIDYIAFGSYGWGGQSAGLIAAQLDGLSFRPLIAPARIYYVPKTEDLENLKNDIFTALDKKAAGG